MQLHPIPAFSDNYIWLLQAPGSPRALVVDPGEAAPVSRELQQRKLELGGILVTHHHWDHTGGLDELLGRWQVPVWGPYNPAIPQVQHRLRDGDTFEVEGFSFSILEVPGHTLDHIAYWYPGTGEVPGILFCGDTLFAAGCGRLFEGDAPTMWASLQRLAALPGDTRVCCAHEYTVANLEFALAVEHDNRALQQRMQREQDKRRRGLPTLPSTLELETATNPFLRCQEAALGAGLERHTGRPLPQQPDQVFAELRAWKDNF